MATAQQPAKQELLERRQRLYAVLSPVPLLPPLCVLAACGLALTSPGAASSPACAWLLAAPLLLIHLIGPLLDKLVLGEQPLPVQAGQPHVASTAWLLAFTALHVAAWVVASITAGATGGGSGFLLALAFGLGGSMAVSLAAGHELAHRRDPTGVCRGLAYGQLALTQLTAYGRAHMHHHQHVGTETDYATAHLGEAYWSFLIRYLVGTHRTAWQEEVKAAQRHKTLLWGPCNLTLVGLGLQAVALGITWGLGGWLALAVHLGAAAVAMIELAGLDYLLHYGLTRARKADGSPAPFTPSLAFNSSFAIENAILFRVLQHSAHHHVSTRPYQQLGFTPEDVAADLRAPEGRAPRFAFGWPMLLTALTVFVPPVFLPLAKPLSERANSAHRREVQALTSSSS